MLGWVEAVVTCMTLVWSIAASRAMLQEYGYYLKFCMRQGLKSDPCAFPWITSAPLPSLRLHQGALWFACGQRMWQTNIPSPMLHDIMASKLKSTLNSKPWSNSIWVVSNFLGHLSPRPFKTAEWHPNLEPTGQALALKPYLLLVSEVATGFLSNLRRWCHSFDLIW